MDFNETPAWLAVISALFACLLITLVAHLSRIASVPGTRQRYIWATVEHVTLYPTVIGTFLQVVGNIAAGNWAWAGVGLATATYYVYVVWRFRRDNDDDWFNSGGPGRMLGNFVRRPLPAHTQ